MDSKGSPFLGFCPWIIIAYLPLASCLPFFSLISLVSILISVQQNTLSKNRHQLEKSFVGLQQYL